MNLSRLTPDQYARLEEQIAERLDYLQRLLDRLYARGFKRDNEMFQVTLQAQKAMQRVWEHVQSNPPNVEPANDGMPF